MNITYDQQADAAYFRLTDERVVQTLPINDYVMIDVDDDGHVVGFEVLTVSSQPALVRALNEQAATGVPIEVRS